MKLTLGFSPCPNDTFIFDAMVNGKIDTTGLSFDYVMEDVETLNLWATQGKLDVTKLSYNTFIRTVNRYAVPHSGSALYAPRKGSLQNSPWAQQTKRLCGAYISMPCTKKRPLY